MHSVNKHILALGRLFLVLFFLANTGLTFILYHCTMCGTADGMACCDHQKPATASHCSDMDSPPQTGATLAAHSASCMVTTVVGGLQTDPKFVEKASFAPQVTKIDFVRVALSASSNGPNVDRPFCLLTSVDSNFSPPSVEKYVLTASFLI